MTASATSAETGPRADRALAAYVVMCAELACIEDHDARNTLARLVMDGAPEMVKAIRAADRFARRAATG